MYVKAKLAVEALESRNLLSASPDAAAEFASCWVEFEEVGDWQQDVLVGFAETYELRATNTHAERSIGVSASAANFFGGISTPEETSFEMFENSVIPIDYDGTLDPGEEVTFVMRSVPRYSSVDPSRAQAEVLVSFSGDGWNQGDFVQFSMGANIAERLHVDIDGNQEIDFEDAYIIGRNLGLTDATLDDGDVTGNGLVQFDDFLAVTELLNGIGGPRAIDITRDGKIEFDDFLVFSANFGKEVDSYYAGDFNIDGIVDFDDFLLLSAAFGT